MSEKHRSMPPITDVYFDESGFTGAALLDPAQPHFVIASSIIDNATASGILKAAFPNYQGDEYKFKNIWDRARSRARLVEFCRLVGELSSSLFVWQIDKKFCVLVKMIDFLMEPIAHAAGYNFYADAYAYRTANYSHFGLKHIGSPELYDATVNAYYEFARDPSEKSLRRLRQRLSLMEKSAPEETRYFFSACLKGARLFHKFNNIETFKETLEIYLTSMLSSVSYWAELLPNKLRLFHDQSNAFFSQKEIWDAIISPNVPNQLHPVANGPAIHFPLPVIGTVGCDSKSRSAIQLCDIVAGLTAKYQTENQPPQIEELFREIFSTRFADVPMNGIAPGTDFPDGPPPLLTGPDPVDQILNIMRAGKRPKA